MSRRTIQIEIDAEAETCNGCRLRMINGLGMSCAAFGGVALVETAHATDWLRCDVCKRNEVAPTSEADARADERRTCLAMARKILAEHGNLAAHRYLDEQLAALAKRGEGGG